MIVDIGNAAPLPLAAHYDVCIAGGGVAGIVLALKLASRRRRVLVLEAGGLEFSDISQDSYRGDIVGHSYPDLDVARLRYLGGTSNHWGGWCRPLDAYDFERRDFIEGSGWPIRITDIRPYLSEAKDILEIGEFAPDRILEGSGELLSDVHFHVETPVLFNEKYRDALAASDAIDVLLNANLIDIVLKPDGKGVDEFEFKGYSDNASVHKVEADAYVLALGGIENARMLLNANKQQPRGLGNDTDLVGRFFLEHPHYTIGYYVLTSTKLPFGKERRFVAPTPKLMQRHRIAGADYRFERVIERGDLSLKNSVKDVIRKTLCASEFVEDLVNELRALQCQLAYDRAGLLKVASEQGPNRHSRVTLGEKTDRFGLRRAALDWRLTPFDQKTMRVGALEIAKYFARRDIGRIKLFDWVLEEQPSFPGVDSEHRVAGFHHMGTTRMGASAQDGVVDRNCRVFGVDNLYIAGSSVFRTAGHANPTLSIVQLALRLGDHLARL